MTLKIENMDHSKKVEIETKIKAKKDFDCLVKTEFADAFILFIEAKGHTAKRGVKHAGGYTECFVFVTP